MPAINKLVKLLWVIGGILCLVVFTSRATPVLLDALGAWLQPFAVFLMLFGVCGMVMCLFFWRSWMFDELDDRKHFFHTRRQFRDVDLQIRRMELQHLRKQAQHSAWLTARRFNHHRKGRLDSPDSPNRPNHDW